MRLAVLAQITIVFLLLGCGNQQGPNTPFNGGLNPPTDTHPENAGPASGEFCKFDTASGKYVSTANPIGESSMHGSNFYARGGGCVERPLRETWAATHNAETLHWKDSDLDGMVRLPHDQVPFLFKGSYSAGPAFFKQKWEMEFYHTVTPNVANPAHVRILYQKVSGTKYIEAWSGTIDLVMLSPTVTSFVSDTEMRGTQIDNKSAEGGVIDLLSRIRVQSPEWKYF